MTDKFPDIDVGEMLTSGVVLPFEAEEPITKGQAVELTADMKVSVTSSGKAYGVAVTSAGAGETCSVCVSGVVKVTAAEAIAAAGSAVKGASAGKVARLVKLEQAVDEGGSATYTVEYDVEECLGRALQTSGGDGDLILVHVGR